LIFVTDVIGWLRDSHNPGTKIATGPTTVRLPPLTIGEIETDEVLRPAGGGAGRLSDGPRRALGRARGP